MSERTTARDVMTGGYRSIDESTSLRDAIRLLQSDDERSRVLLATREDGSVAGLLTPRILLRSLFANWSPERADADDRSAEERLLDRARERLDDPVADLLVREMLPAGPDDSLLQLMETMAEKRVEVVVVTEEGRAAGVVRLPDVFRAASALALAPTTEGQEADEPEDRSPRRSRRAEP